MRFSLVTAALAVAGSALAEDLLFLDDLVGHEEDHALALGFTTKVVTETEWRAMKTSDFAAFKAIIIGDPGGSRDVGRIKFLEDTNTIWGPAVTGNIIIHGILLYARREAVSNYVQALINRTTIVLATEPPFSSITVSNSLLLVFRLQVSFKPASICLSLNTMVLLQWVRLCLLFRILALLRFLGRILEV